ncbi:MAG TPA: hypothetical protein VFX50_10480 [Gemmatimonadales bacterium]|nr:hypothetical protein [Gemmatimonadales bacterium]
MRKLLVLSSLLAAAYAGPASAQPLVFPAGIACPGFDLQVSGVGTPPERLVMDRRGNQVTIVAGIGDALTFTNLSTQATYSLRAAGAVIHTTTRPDGSQTVSTEGHVVLVWFPTDVPPGPTTTLYVGRTQYTVDTSGVFTLGRTAGRATDICAALS